MAETSSLLNDESSSKRVVIVGGSFAGLSALRHLSDHAGTSITLVEPKDFFEYTPAVHHVLAGHQDSKAILTSIENCIPSGVKFVRDQILEIDYENKSLVLESHNPIMYDYLICATGASYAAPVRGSINLEDRRKELRHFRERVKECKKVVCIGGGLVGVEMAAEIKAYYPEKEIYVLDLLTEVLASLPERAQRWGRAYLEKLGVQLYLGRKSNIETSKITFDDGEVIDNIDLIIWCCGSRPHVHVPSEENKTTRMGYMINDNLQISNLKNVFSCGDCADGAEFGAMKTAYVAEEMGKVAAKNVIHSIKSEKLMSYPKCLYGVKKPPTLVLVSLGPKSCIMVLNDIVLQSQVFLWFKHFIAWSKMKQAELYKWSDLLWTIAERATGWLHYLLVIGTCLLYGSSSSRDKEQ